MATGIDTTHCESPGRPLVEHKINVLPQPKWLGASWPLAARIGTTQFVAARQAWRAINVRPPQASALAPQWHTNNCSGTATIAILAFDRYPMRVISLSRYLS